jgi:ABC-2 type transport system permease protein
MRAIWVIARRELSSLFVSPMAYVIMIFVTFILGWFFVYLVGAYAEYSMRMAMNPVPQDFRVDDVIIRNFYSTFAVIMVFVAPVLSMRALAEERRQRTAELILTAPISTMQIVLGKYLGLLLMALFMLALTLAFPLWLALQDAPPEPGPLAAACLGALLASASFLAVGLFSSSMTSNQVIAAVVAFVLCLFFWVVGAPAESGSGAFSPLLESLSISARLEDFMRGVIDTRALVFFLSFIGAGLFFTGRVLDSSRWR